jgi:hypothetical protein
LWGLLEPLNPAWLGNVNRPVGDGAKPLFQLHYPQFKMV